jgi:anti-sigma factor RsiW
VKPGETELHAYVDDALDAGTRRDVEAHLAQSPEDAARVAAYMEQRDRLHALYDEVLEEPVPDALRQAAVRPAARRAYAWAAGWLIAGIAIGWGLARFTDAPADIAVGFPRQAAIAHVVYSPEVRHPVEVGADQEEHLVRWLSKRVGTTLKAPVLTREGYGLVGGRLLPGEGGAVAQFMYQDAKGQRLTLYVSKLAQSEGTTAFRYTRENDISVFYWVDGSVGYALSGALPKDELLAVATSVYKQLNP